MRTIETPTRAPQDAAAAFHQSWFPLALAREVQPGQVMGRDFLGTRVVLYRDAAGRPLVQSAYCPHLGADLSVGQVLEGQIRCAYHHWRFDGGGRCVDIPAGDKIPPGARIATYPSAEAWGLVWAFNGDAPSFPVPRIPGADERDLVWEAHVRGTRAQDPWVSTSNGVDFQHLRTLHGLPAVDPADVRVGEHSIEYRIESPHVLQHGLITGVNTFSQHLAIGGDDMFMLFTGAPIAHGRSMGFYVFGVPDTGGGRAAVAEKLDGLRGLVERLLAEDAPVLDTIRFRPGVLVASDRHLARFFEYVREFPRAVPPGA
ncbi:MAG TPA: Rieske 2Fe-2S domain-containing protein [Candidatus Methylomirabilis sp.]|nr:Rieske 2Fe-2S domain-containing protein [Candidatus Methylomirabilis sp.]